MINIRKANKEEVSDLQDLNDEVFVDNQQYDPDLDMSWAQSDRGRKYFSNLFDSNNGICLIAEDGERKVGYIAGNKKEVSYRNSRYIELENMGVIPEYRSKGIGKMLVKKFLEEAKLAGFQKAYVNSYFKNSRAIDFYKRNGFSEIDLSLEMDIK